eukprot:scaffold283899_cov17-Prasinocladus_malaysianus.AAC.1
MRIRCLVGRKTHRIISFASSAPECPGSCCPYGSQRYSSGGEAAARLRDFGYTQGRTTGVTINQ